MSLGESGGDRLRRGSDLVPGMLGHEVAPEASRAERDGLFSDMPNLCFRPGPARQDSDVRPMT